MSLRTRFTRDFLSLLTSRTAAQGFTLLVGLLLVRMLPDSVFGAYSLATTTIGLAGVFVDFGLDSILTRETAGDRERGSNLIGAAIVIRVCATGTVLALMAAIALATPTIGRLDLLLIGGLGLAPRGIGRTLLAYFNGSGRVRATARIEGLAALVTSILTILLAWLRFGGDGAIGAVIALSLGALVLALLVLGDRPVCGFSWPRFLDLRMLIALALPFLIINVAGTAFQSLDIYVVKALYGTATRIDAVALYAAPFRILNALLLVPTAWGVVALPRYVRYRERPTLLRLALTRDLRFNVILGAGLCIVCTIFAQPLTVIGLGRTYLDAAPILALLCWMTFPVCLSAPYIAVLTAQNRQWRIASAVCLSGTVALVANLVLGRLNSPETLLSGLLVVAGVKVASMWLLLAAYWIAAHS
jgi:O-antigen/teichoic acid export membrane protein